MTTELKKIPDSATNVYISALQKNNTDSNLKPLFLSSIDIKPHKIDHVSLRIKRDYPAIYWERGCKAEDEFPHHYFMKQHVKCNICNARFHSKFECKEHKHRHHAY